MQLAGVTLLAVSAGFVLRGADAVEREVLVPTPQRDVLRGEPLSDVAYTLRTVPERSSFGILSNIAEYHRSYALATLQEGAPILASHVSARALEQNSVVQRIPEGMRAITVRVDAESAVEGWARSGARVDVILVHKKERTMRSTIIASNVEILSAGSSTVPLRADDTTSKAPNTVTLLVSQDVALRIKTAAMLGSLTFALRGSDDSRPVDDQLIDESRLFPADSKPSAEDSIRGVATDADGRSYILKSDSRWLRATPEVARSVSPSAARRARDVDFDEEVP
ncbi:MAG: Flp pilus assembly protein CpaB [Deltaproteobacteria bacterium]|nr:Flp pilus assembly protein CpaB [Deltaproteobacteria bacterium]